MTELARLIRKYYTHPDKLWPKDADEAVDWAITEIGEVKEVLLHRPIEPHGEPPAWVRNHPDEAPVFSMSRLLDELGDVMMMIQVAGMVEGYDVLGHLKMSLHNKITQIKHDSPY